MNLKENLPVILAVVALGLAVTQEVHPMGFRIHPGLMLIVALLLGLRWAMRRQARKRAERLREVPQHPLGIGED